MRYPNFVKEGDRIGFAAPSFGCVIEPYHTAFLNALKYFEGLGFEPRLGPNCFADCGVGISNTPEKCGQELNAMYKDPEVEMIISCGGGELMCEVVPYMDFGAIAKSRPKWYLGYSDNTNFTFLSAILADTAALYGPCAATFGMEPKDPSLLDVLAFLKGEKSTFSGYPLWEREKAGDEEHPLAPYHLTEPQTYRAFGGNRVSGRLLGGCLDCLGNLVGTRFDRVKEFAEKYKEDGIVWFLEACDLNVMSIRRTLWNLKEAGWFKNASGFLIGRPACYGQEMMGLDQYEAVTSVLGDLGLPILMDLDFGHLPPQLPIVCGACCEAELSDGQFTIEYKLNR